MADLNPDLPELTPERVQILVEFADNVAAGRRIMRMIAWLGGVTVAAAAAAYYIIGAWNGWHSLNPRQP